MTADRLRVGIIGTGRISDLHAIEYLANPATEITALCDRDVVQARAKAARWGIPGVAVEEDIDRFLAREDVDLVEILLPHDLHLPVALKAMAAGKIISLQKPMCRDLAEADALVEAAEAYDRPVKVFENFIFYPPVLKARALIDAGAIGTPLSIRIKSNPAKSATAWEVPVAANAWRQDKAGAGGGPLVFDDGHHKFALAWHFMGNPEEVHAFIGDCEGPGGIRFDAPSIISFRFPGGGVGNLEIVYSPEMEMNSVYYAQDDRVEITGTEGIIFIAGGHGHLGTMPPVTLYRDGAVTSYDVPMGWEQSFVNSTRHYIEALRDGRPPVLTAREARQVLRFALAAEQSARENRTIRLDV